MTKDDNPGYMTVKECRQISGKIQLALFGRDGRAGMVKDISDLSNSMKDIKTALDNQNTREKNKAELSNKWKITIYGSVITAIGLVVVEFIKLMASL